MNRETLIDQLEWYTDDVPPEDHMWRRRGRLKSIVIVKGPPNGYSDEELESLVAFSERQTADYDTMWNPRDQVRARDGCNAILIGKVFEKWMRKRLSWYIGPMFSETLAEAMEVFDKNLKSRLADEMRDAGLEIPE
jgi:hypothetical protein